MGTQKARLRRDLEEILGRVPTDQEIAAERGIPTEVGTALEQISLRERIRQEFQKARKHADADWLVDRLEERGTLQGLAFFSLGYKRGELGVSPNLSTGGHGVDPAKFDGDARRFMDRIVKKIDGLERVLGVDPGTGNAPERDPVSFAARAQLMDPSGRNFHETDEPGARLWHRLEPFPDGLTWNRFLADMGAIKARAKGLSIAARGPVRAAKGKGAGEARGLNPGKPRKEALRQIVGRALQSHGLSLVVYRAPILRAIIQA